ncbi:hypothetical protein [Phytohabitans kaempferiae]|uniref:Uncharacterized protein n=1 Tax=Phytohabitans kaempferiae TaxID=1620943 RepID=A0ABV6M5P6_9ACTN
MTAAPEPRHELLFMCADTGAVVRLTGSGRAPHVTVFLASGETLWGLAGARGSGLARVGDGRSELRVSATAALFTAPAHIVRDEPPAARPVPVNLAVTVEPSGVPVALPGRSPRTAAVVQATGSLGVGSVIYRVRGAGWASSLAAEAGEPYGSRARAVFQDRSAAYLTDGPDAAAALTRYTDLHSAPVDDFVVRGPERGPAHRLRCAVGGRSPAVVAGELRDTEQYLTVAEPAPDGAGWAWWSATPFVFVRSGVTGLGLVERTVRSASAQVPPAAEGLPDPY